MTSKNRILWVQYPCITAGESVIRYGLFDVHFINDMPAHADPVKIVGLQKKGNEFFKQVQSIQYACQQPMLICTNAVNMDKEWNGSLIFDHLPVLS